MGKPKNKVFKGFRPTLGYFLFVFLVFPKVFRKTNKHSGKPTIEKKTKENKNTFGKQTNKTTFGKTKKTKNPNPYPRVGLKPLNTCSFWFSRRFLEKEQKHSGKPKIQKKQRKPQTTLRKPKTMFLKVSDPPLDMHLFLFISLLVFPKVFRKPTKHSGKPTIEKKTKENKQHLRENKKTKQLSGKPKKQKTRTHIQGWV